MPNSPIPTASATGPATGPSFVTLPAAAHSGPLSADLTSAHAALASASTGTLNATIPGAATPTISGSTATATATGGPIHASPLALSRESTWPADAATASASDPSVHLSGTEPRYFPGVATRSQRRNSIRKNSYHEMDDGTVTGSGSATNRLRKTGSFGAPEEEEDGEGEA